MRTALAAMTAILIVAPAAAQEPDDLTRLLDTLAVLWTRGDAVALASHGAEMGLDLEVHGETIGPLQGRRAAAALRQLFQTQETVSVQTGSSARIVGAEDRAFGEFIWVVRMPGVGVTEDNKIFVALVREDDGWRVSQIRILH
jgi:hypothetical protein